MQDQITSQSRPNTKTVLEIAQAHEMAEKCTQQLQQRPQSSSLFKIAQAKMPNP